MTKLVQENGTDGRRSNKVSHELVRPYHLFLV